MQVLSTYWLEKVLKIILCVNAQRIVIHAVHFSSVSSPNFSPNIFLQVFQCFLDYLYTLFPSNSLTDESHKWIDPAIAAEN